MGTEESGSWQSWGRVDASLTLVYFLVKLSYIFWRWENETSDVNKDLKALFSNYPSPYLEFHKSQYDNYYDQLSLSAICSSHNLDPEPLLWQETHLLTVIINTSMSILQDNLQNFPFILYTCMNISIGEVPPSNGSDKHSKKSSWNVLNVAIMIKTG